MPTGLYGPPRRARSAIEQTGLLEQHRRLEHVRHRLAHRDDVVGHRVRAEYMDGAGAAATDVEFLAGQFRQFGAIADQGSAGAEFGHQQFDAVGLGQRPIVRMHAGPRQQLGDDLLVHVGVLPHVQTGQVKTEDVHGFPQPGQPVVGQYRAAVGAQRRVDDVEVGQQLRRSPVALEAEVQLVLGLVVQDLGGGRGQPARG